MRSLASRLALISLLGAASPLAAQRFVATGFPDKVVLDYFQRLQVAIVNNNHAVVVGMVRYPLQVNHGGAIHDTIRTAADLLKQYDAVFSPPIRQAIILERSPKLFGNQQGVAIARGTVWLSGKCDRAHPPVCTLGISSVNFPAPR